MARMTFGTVLQEARERKGYDLVTAARRLRIRPDILRAIEENDFSRMPPRGYARNMVNAYARLLDLNPTEITRMYLDEAYAYQIGRARADAQPSGFDMDGSSRSQRIRERSSQDAAGGRQQPHQNTLGRETYDDRNAYGRIDYGRRGDRTDRQRTENRTHPSRHTVLPNSQYTNFYAGPQASRGVQSKLPFIIAGAVILVVLIIILALTLGGGGDTEEDVPRVPVTGLDDTTQDTDGTEEGSDAAGQETPAAVEPTKAVLAYTVASGTEPWIELYLDGSDSPYFAQAVTGPVEDSIDVSGTLMISTPQPGSVSVTVDGVAVELVDNNGYGVYEYTVDFPAILAQWKADNPSPSTAASDTDAAIS